MNGLDTPPVTNGIVTMGTEVSRREFERLRKLLRLSQRQLARRMGTTAATVSRWEAGKRPIPELASRFLTLLVETESRKEAR